MISILTATYNREQLLPILYESLRRQTSKDFEWVVVDDGSVDNTEALVKRWTADDNNTFPIRYVKRENGGKHRAVNTGMQIVEGDYVAIMDSDDYFLDDAIETIIKCIDETKGMPKIAGVMLSQGVMQADGSLKMNGAFGIDNDSIDVTSFMRNRKHLRGDRLEVMRSELMREYPFPEFEGEKFVTESAVWNKMSEDGYMFRMYKKIVCVIEYRSDGITKQFAKTREKNYKGYTYSISLLYHNSSIFECFWVVWNYVMISKKIGVPAATAAKNIGMSTLLFQCIGVLCSLSKIVGFSK